MLIKFGSIVTDGRGKLGGQVYSKNRGGNYVRNNAVPSNPQTSFQMASRGILTSLSQGWSGLSQADRDAWNASTEGFQRTNAFGDLKRLSGKNLYTSLNKELITVGASVLDEPPTPSEILAPVTISGAITDGPTFEVDVETEGDVDDGFYVIRATPAVSAGTSFVKNKLRVISTGNSDDLENTVDVAQDYIDRFGDPQLGQKIFFSCYTVNTAGQRSPEVTGYAVVTAV